MTVALNYQDPGILYELWNEPSSNTEEEEGGDLAYWKKYRPYWRVLTDAIRSSGSSNVVLVAPPLWAFNLRGLRESLLPDEQTGYVWHVYPGHYPEEWADTLDDLDKEKPVIVTEWGFEPDAKQHWSGMPRNTARRSPISWTRAGCHRPPGAGTPTTAPACASRAASSRCGASSRRTI